MISFFLWGTIIVLGLATGIQGNDTVKTVLFAILLGMHLGISMMQLIERSDRRRQGVNHGRHRQEAAGHRDS